MKEQYAYDINDYEKYAILRELTAVTGLPLIVVWMLTASDESGHGQDRRYLKDPGRYRDLDPELFDALKRLDAIGFRGTRVVEESGILGPTRFLRTQLSASVASRLALMDAWRAAAAKTGPALAFFDPDTGLAPKDVRKGGTGSERYLYDDELAEAYAGSGVLVAFQYRHQATQHDKFVIDLFARARRVCNPAVLIALYNGRVAHLILAHAEHAGSVRQAVDRLAGRSGGQLKLAYATVPDEVCV